MESSKSEGNKEKLQDDKTIADNQTVRGIIDPNVEKEIQNVLIPSECDQHQPSCSWKDTEPNPTQTETKQPEVVLPTDSSVSSLSIDVHFSPNETCVQKEATSSNEPTSCETTPRSTDFVVSSLSNLFDDIEEVVPIEPNLTTFTLPKSTVTSHLRFQPPPVPVHVRNPEVPSTTRREIHIRNIPNDSINRSLQRQDTIVNVHNSNTRALSRTEPVLGPPPSYSKSLLDRRVNPCASIQFVAPIPPPSYDGMENELRYAHTLGQCHTGGFTLGLGNTWQGQPQPAYCPVCETVIITQVDVRVSRIAHIVAMVMFLLLCWPFCLLPYFLNVCNYTFHYCSVCRSYLGARRPFQRT